MHEPDWIILRFGSSVPAEEIAPELNGRWFDRSILGGHLAITRAVPKSPGTTTVTHQSIAFPTGRFEMDEDFNVGEVWEINSWH